MVKPKKISIFWDDVAKADLKKIYNFNKKNFSIEFAKKITVDIYKIIENITFVEQWQKDEILGGSFRRILLKNYKIVYTEKSKNKIYILMVFDTRQNPKKYKIKN